MAIVRARGAWSAPTTAELTIAFDWPRLPVADVVVTIFLRGRRKPTNGAACERAHRADGSCRRSPLFARACYFPALSPGWLTPQQLHWCRSSVAQRSLTNDAAAANVTRERERERASKLNLRQNFARSCSCLFFLSIVRKNFAVFRLALPSVTCHERDTHWTATRRATSGLRAAGLVEERVVFRALLRSWLSWTEHAGRLRLWLAASQRQAKTTTTTARRASGDDRTNPVERLDIVRLNQVNFVCLTSS